MSTRITNGALHGVALALVAIVCALALLCAAPYQAHAASLKTGTPEKAVKVTTQAKKTYTIGPNSKPFKAGLVNSSAYTKQTKHFWLIKSYMDEFERAGGGTLIFKKGTYNLPTSIQVPSNVKLVFKTGVKIKKTFKVGKSTLKTNTPLFQLVPPKKYSKKASVKKYGGSKNVSFVGKGNVVFDMNNAKTGCAIIMAQNQNVTFTNITFKNAHAHFFELDASKNVTISGCKFMNLTGGKTCEAINLDTPDKATGGFSFKWCKLDKTPNDTVTIKNCTFTNVARGIGTHKYSQANGANVMHKNIQILNNTFTGVSGYEGAVVPYNWENVTISGNTFTGKGATDRTYGITAHSVVNATISNNTFSSFSMPIIIRRGFTSSGYGAPAEVNLTDANIKALATNKCKANTMSYYFVGISKNPYYWDKSTSNPTFTTVDIPVI